MSGSGGSEPYRVIYLDHAATSFPKAPGVAEAVVDCMERIGGNPGRSGHRLSVEAARVMHHCRTRLARLFDAPFSEGVIFTKNATEAINLALGVLEEGDGVLVTPFQHNAVMRPLNALVRRMGIEVAGVKVEGDTSPGGWLRRFESLCREVKPRLVVVNHGSNVMGEVAPLAELCGIAKKVGAMVLVDAAQTAGVLPISVRDLGIDFLAFTGHKGLRGPKGTGGLVIACGALPPPLVCGGTGSRSEEEEQPEMLPDRYESGTPNAEGIAGLDAALRWLEETGLEKIHQHEMGLLEQFAAKSKGLKGVSFWGPRGSMGVAVCSILLEGMDPAWLSTVLDREHGIMTRPGLHCAPAAHRALGTFPSGTVRVSFGFTNTADDVEVLVDALKRIVREA